MNQKNIFVPVIVLLEIRYLFQTDLKLALVVKRVARISLTFLPQFKKLETTKTIDYNFFASRGKLERYCKQ